MHARAALVCEALCGAPVAGEFLHLLPANGEILFVINRGVADGYGEVGRLRIVIDADRKATFPIDGNVTETSRHAQVLSSMKRRGQSRGPSRPSV